MDPAADLRRASLAFQQLRARNVTSLLLGKGNDPNRRNA
jgi:hypothetical protein